MTSATQLEYALLGLISQGVRSGYGLRKQFASTPMGHFSDSPGSIYPALRRLVRRNWIRRLEEPGGPRGRQTFGLTKAGTAAFQSWLKAPPRRGDVAQHYDELLLRFAFMGSAVARPSVISFLKAFERQAADYARELRTFLKSMPDTNLPTGRLALENGAMQFETQARWARRAVARLRRLR